MNNAGQEAETVFVQEGFYRFLSRIAQILEHQASNDDSPISIDDDDLACSRALSRLTSTEKDPNGDLDELRYTLSVSWLHFQKFFYAEAELVRLNYPRFRLPLIHALYRVLTEDLGLDATESHELGYSVAFHDIPTQYTVRELRASQCGLLCNLHATVTRMTQVRPELLQTCFSCQNCGCVSDPVLQNYTYTTPIVCKQDGCGNRDQWAVVYNRNTILNDWQKLKVQEDSEALLPGSTPRSIDVILRGESVERALPGDKLRFIGFISMIPEVGKLFSQQERRELTHRVDDAAPNANEGRRADMGTEGVEGLKKLGARTLAYKLCFIAMTVTNRAGYAPNRPFADEKTKSFSLSKELRSKQESVASRVVSRDGFFNTLVHSVCPNLFGYALVKLGVLLQQVGGVHKKTRDGSSLRGDINLCLIGDPAVGKSHFLKWASKIAPRGIYTSGKTSTAAGLTASVAKDPDTGEFTIEAGALMLADNGLCCIDDFDKMDPADMVAIHEAMEQQTISIAKAGIKATLRARASILAAASPIGGIYNISKPLHQNVTMTQPIISRFDLIFILADTSNKSDRMLAKKITDLHRHNSEQPEDTTNETLSHEDFMLYLSYATSVQPRLSESACDLLSIAFRDLRMEKTRTVTHRMFRYTTRQLESMIRLSEAVARLHLDDEVRTDHVRMALTLMKASMTHTDISSDFAQENQGIPNIDESNASNQSSSSRGSEIYDLVKSKIAELPQEGFRVSDIADYLAISAPEIAGGVNSTELYQLIRESLIKLEQETLLHRGTSSDDAGAEDDVSFQVSQAILQL